MRKRARGRKRGLLYLCLYIVMISMCLMGVSYAGWSGVLDIDSGFTTGSFSTVFQREGCSISITDSSDKVVKNLNNYDYSINISRENAVNKNDGTEIELKTDSSFPFTELNKADRYLRIQIPVKSGKKSTVNHIEATKADFSNPEKEQLEMRYENVWFSVDGVNRFELPKSYVENAGKPLFNLKFNVFRAVKEENNIVYAVIYLGLHPDYWNAMGANVSITIPEDDAAPVMKEGLGFQGSDITQSGTISIEYKCSIPVFIEQGNYETVKIGKDSQLNGVLK